MISNLGGLIESRDGPYVMLFCSVYFACVFPGYENSFACVL